MERLGARNYPKLYRFPNKYLRRTLVKNKLNSWRKDTFSRKGLFGLSWLVQQAWNPLYWKNAVHDLHFKARLVRNMWYLGETSKREVLDKNVTRQVFLDTRNPTIPEKMLSAEQKNRLTPDRQAEAFYAVLSRLQREKGGKAQEHDKAEILKDYGYAFDRMMTREEHELLEKMIYERAHLVSAAAAVSRTKISNPNAKGLAEMEAKLAEDAKNFEEFMTTGLGPKARELLRMAESEFIARRAYFGAFKNSKAAYTGEGLPKPSSRINQKI